ncbi:MAG: Ger(x)C family spore germination protein [Clostridia bacterium]|nr:Ger(x)C family spore germination protein [Clostridia bacterium]
MIIIKVLNKKYLIIILIIVFLVAFSTSYNSLIIDRLAYVVAIGIDSTDNNTYSFTFQFTNVTTPSESGNAEKSPSIVNNVEATSLSSAINLMNTYMGKRVNLSHCKVIVFSEKIAMQGISNLIYTLINNPEVRPSANIVVSKCTAKNYIENSKPIFENLITKYYDVFPSSSSFTGYTADATLGDFINYLECPTSNPVAILGGLNTENIEKTSTLSQNEEETAKSNETTITGKRGSENIGLAVFKNDKMVGELNAIECLSYLNMSNNVKGFFVTVPDPQNAGEYLDLYMSPTKPIKIKLDIINDSPYIEINANYNARIYSMKTDAKYLNNDVLNSISNSCNSFLESTFSNYLYKTAKDFKSDINGFGKYALSKFWTTKEFNDFNWLESYENSFFKINVNTNVESSVHLNET